MEFNSIVQFLENIGSYEEQDMYRGQARHNWDLLPSIARIDVEELSSNYSDGWRGIERDLLNSFKKHAVRFLEKEPKSKIEWMIQAQHHGVPTRLLDWSTNPLKALYFAVENPAHDDFDGIVYLFSPRVWRTSSHDVDGDDEKVITAFHPHFINDRVASQDGCFSLFPFSRKITQDTFEPMKDGFCPQNDLLKVNKVIISKESKSTLRDQLSRLGVTDVSMFPDLDGVAKSIRRTFGCL
ncbi:FRG domain-containing protein [Pseudocolwellia sp. HL-MZ7]|uniref:FRG domain-containing protein n=1 Tax=Pseudocolwellia sp. HL-MZ7 TaxID=3400627 RepID=UPI003CFA67EC